LKIKIASLITQSWNTIHYNFIIFGFDIFVFNQKMRILSVKVLQMAIVPLAFHDKLMTERIIVYLFYILNHSCVLFALLKHYSSLMILF
jgi:hypothetical protein